MIHPRAAAARSRALLAEMRGGGVARPKRRVGQIPRPVPPNRIIEGLAAELRSRVLGLAREAAARQFPAILRELAHLRRAQGREDATLALSSAAHVDTARMDVLPILAGIVLDLLIGLIGDALAAIAMAVFEEAIAAAITAAGAWLAEALASLTASEIAAELAVLLVRYGTSLLASKARRKAREAIAAHRRRDAEEDDEETEAKRLGRELAERLIANAKRRRKPPAPPAQHPTPEEERRARVKAGELDHELAHATEEGRRAARLIDRAAKAFADAFDPVDLKNVVKQFAARMSRHSRLQLDAMLRSAIGIPLDTLGPDVEANLDEWAALNVDRIVTMPETYFDRLRLDILDAFEGGMHPATLAEQFVKRYEMGEYQAERIARTELIKLGADLNRNRMMRVGIARARWRTVRDNRVSPDCAALEGVVFDVEKGVHRPDGSVVWPGSEHPDCRCWSEPLLDDLING